MIKDEEAIKYIEYGYHAAKCGYTLETTILLFRGVRLIFNLIVSLSK